MRSGLKLFAIASGLTFLSLGTASAGDRDRDRDSCSNNMLKGHYAHMIQGSYGPSTVPFSQTFADALPFQGIQMLEFDGKGTLTGSESLMAGGGELTNSTGKHFTPVVGTFKINADCTGIAYLCSNHSTGTVSSDPCNANTLDNPGGWDNFIQVTVVLAERGRKFHMLAVPPFDTRGVIRTISGTGTRLEDVSIEPFR